MGGRIAESHPESRLTLLLALMTASLTAFACGAFGAADATSPTDGGADAGDPLVDARGGDASDPRDGAPATDEALFFADFEANDLLGVRGASAADPPIQLITPGLNGQAAARASATKSGTLTFTLASGEPDVVVTFLLKMISNPTPRPRIVRLVGGGQTTLALVIDANGALEAQLGSTANANLRILGSSTGALVGNVIYRVTMRFASVLHVASVSFAPRTDPATEEIARVSNADVSFGSTTAIELGATTLTGADIVLDDIEIRRGQ